MEVPCDIGPGQLPTWFSAKIEPSRGGSSLPPLEDRCRSLFREVETIGLGSSYYWIRSCHRDQRRSAAMMVVVVAFTQCEEGCLVITEQLTIDRAIDRFGESLLLVFCFSVVVGGEAASFGIMFSIKRLSMGEPSGQRKMGWSCWRVWVGFNWPTLSFLWSWTANSATWSYTDDGRGFDIVVCNSD